MGSHFSEREFVKKIPKFIIVARTKPSFVLNSLQIHTRFPLIKTADEFNFVKENQKWGTI